MEKFDILTGKQEVKDYPYGRFRTTVFRDVEFKPKFGFRSSFQSINPRTGRLNNPKYGTYYPFMVMYKDPKTGYIENKTFNFFGIDEVVKFIEFLKVNKGIKMTEDEKFFVLSKIQMSLAIDSKYIIGRKADNVSVEDVFKAMSFDKFKEATRNRDLYALTKIDLNPKFLKEVEKGEVKKFATQTKEQAEKIKAENKAKIDKMTKEKQDKMALKPSIEQMKTEVVKVLNSEMPKGTMSRVEIGKDMFGENLRIFATVKGGDTKMDSINDKLMVSLRIDKDLELKPQIFGGAGGQSISRKPNLKDSKEKYLAQKGVKIPFRTPKAEKEAVLRALQLFIQKWVKTLQSEYKAQTLFDEDIKRVSKIDFSTKIAESKAEPKKGTKKPFNLITTNAGGVDVVSDKNREEKGDYKKVATISPSNGEIKWFFTMAQKDEKVQKYVQSISDSYKAKKETKPTINKTGYVLKDLKEAKKIEKTPSVMSLFTSKDRQFVNQYNTMLFIGSLGSFMWTDGKRALEISKYGTELKALGNATAKQKEAYKRATDRMDKDTKGNPVFKKTVAKKQEPKKTEVKPKPKTNKPMATKTASKTRLQKKTLEQLLQGNDCEKLQGVTQIVVKMMKAKSNDPKKVKRLSNEASYIYNGLRSGKCEQSKIKTVKAIATKAWSKIIEADEKRQLKQPFTVPSDATKFFNEALKEFGMKKQAGKAIKKLPTKLF